MELDPPGTINAVFISYNFKYRYYLLGQKWVVIGPTLKRNEGREYLINVWAMGLALMAFLNPSTRVHYFIFYVPAFCSVIGSIIKDAKRSVWLIFTALLSFVAIALTTEGVVGKGLNNNLEALSIPTWGFVLLLCGMVLVLREPRGTVRTS